MKKWIAILFFTLLCSTTLLPGTHLHVDAVEQLADSDKSKETKPDKKEGKEYIAAGAKKQQASIFAAQPFVTHVFFWLPRPIIKKPTPPPNVIC